MGVASLAFGVGQSVSSSGTLDATPLIASIVLVLAAVWIFRLPLSVPMAVACLVGGLVWAALADMHGGALATVVAAVVLYAAVRAIRDPRRMRG